MALAPHSSVFDRHFLRLMIETLRPLPFPHCPQPEKHDEEVEADGVQQWSVRCYPQRSVYAHLGRGNGGRWFECAICAEERFRPTDEAVQHSPKHPPVCTDCLGKVLRCPFCRTWIGNDRVVHFLLRITQPVTARVQYL